MGRRKRKKKKEKRKKRERRKKRVKKEKREGKKKEDEEIFETVPEAVYKIKVDKCYFLLFPSLGI